MEPQVAYQRKIIYDPQDNFCLSEHLCELQKLSK